MAFNADLVHDAERGHFNDAQNVDDDISKCEDKMEYETKKSRMRNARMRMQVMFIMGRGILQQCLVLIADL